MLERSGDFSREIEKLVHSVGANGNFCLRNEHIFSGKELIFSGNSLSRKFPLKNVTLFTTADLKTDCRG